MAIEKVLSTPSIEKGIVQVGPNGETTVMPLDPALKNSGGNTNTGSTSSKENTSYSDITEVLGESPKLPESTDASAGAAAAEGTQYSWDKQGTDQAQTQYQQDVLAAKQNALANRQTIEQNAVNYQQQTDMMTYANNQNAEKVGWTGGYVLDQNRQIEYLKSSIQAQMFGAMELQKYGYDSALAAARLSYDLNQKEFAHKYYQDAVNVALSEAQITGTYFSAETRDMMSQLNAADQEMGYFNSEGKALSVEEIREKINALPEGEEKAAKQRALAVRENIEQWYKANDVSTTGIQTLAAWETEQTLAQQWAMSQWEIYQAALSAANNKELDTPGVFIEFDKDGNPVYDGTSIKTKDFNTMTNKQIADYAKTGTQAKSQVTGHVNNMFEETILNELKTYKTYTNDKGEKVPIVDETSLKEAILKNEDAKEIAKELGVYKYSTEAGDSTVDITMDDKGTITVDITKHNIQKPTETPEPNTETQVTNNPKLTTEEKAEAEKMLNNEANKLLPMKELTVNQAGDKFTNNEGDRKDGNDFSLLFNGEKIRVQNGPQVKYDSALDAALNAYSTAQGSVALVDGVLYVRDNACWYVVEARELYPKHWQKLASAYNLNYTSAYESEYYTYDKQKER